MSKWIKNIFRKPKVKKEQFINTDVNPCYQSAIQDMLEKGEYIETSTDKICLCYEVKVVKNGSKKVLYVPFKDLIEMNNLPFSNVVLPMIKQALEQLRAESEGE